MAPAVPREAGRMSSEWDTLGTTGPAGRRSSRRRVTRETDVAVELGLDGAGRQEVATGLPFFDHMLEQLGRHGNFDLVVRAAGDVDVDAHHTVEDVGIVLGEALNEALGERRGIVRYASVSLPLDEALVDVALDCSGRAFLRYSVDLPAAAAGLGNPPFDWQLAEEFWRAFVGTAGVTLHMTLRYGRNTHHVLEASFKGVARALRAAVRVEGSEVPSTKGVLGSDGLDHR
jgi:imidazoleglycerol-phosphate dehydratase